MGGIKSLFHPIDLTVGKIWKVIIKFTIPIVFSYLLQQLYTLVDAAICGQLLNANQVAGVNDTASLTFIFLQFSIGCATGFSVILSNEMGKKDMPEARKSFATQIALSVIICILLTVIAVVCIDPLLALIGITPSANPTNQEVYRSAYSYVLVIFLGIAAQFFYNLICCVLRSLGDSFTPLVFLFFSTVLNIGLDLLFIAVFKMGVWGAAVATVLAQAVSAIGCFIYTFYRYPEMRLKKSDFKLTFRFCAQHLKQGIPLGLQFSILAFGLIAMQHGVIAFDKMPDGSMVEGLPAQNGYAAACKVINFLMMPFNALGTTMISYCGQNDGANQPERIRKGLHQGMLIMLCVYVIVGAIGMLLSINGAYQYLFLSADKISPQSIRYGNMALYADIPLYFLLGALFVYRQSIQGLGIWQFPLLAGTSELIARVVICLTLPAAVNGGAINATASDFSYLCLCAADPGAWLAAVLILGYAVCRYVYFPKRKKDAQPQPSEKHSQNA